MQVSATLIAAQQAAREARARLQVPTPPAAGFAAALGQAAPADAFSALPLKQTASMSASPAPQQAAPGARLGTLLDITV